MHWCFSTSDLSCLETQTHPGCLSSTNQGTLRIRSRSLAVLPPLPQVLGDVCSSSFALRLLRFTSATGHLQPAVKGESSIEPGEACLGGGHTTAIAHAYVHAPIKQSVVGRNAVLLINLRSPLSHLQDGAPAFICMARLAFSGGVLWPDKCSITAEQVTKGGVV